MTLASSDHRVIDREAWLAVQRDHLAEEKAFTKQREAMAAARRALPWLELTEPYVLDTAGFDTPEGQKSLRDLFGDKNQLVVYHFMFGPDWGDEGCPNCSFWADNYNGTHTHLAHRDTAFYAVSRASLDQIAAYQKRMGWDFPWVSSGRCDFNFDLGVSATQAEIDAEAKIYNFGTATPMSDESPGVSVFARDGDRVFLTYQTFARGLDLLNGAYHLLDLTPKGRDEAELPWPMAWLQRHDAYPD